MFANKVQAVFLAMLIFAVLAPAQVDEEEAGVSVALAYNNPGEDLSRLDNSFNLAVAWESPLSSIPGSWFAELSYSSEMELRGASFGLTRVSGLFGIHFKTSKTLFVTGGAGITQFQFDGPFSGDDSEGFTLAAGLGAHLKGGWALFGRYDFYFQQEPTSGAEFSNTLLGIKYKF